MNVKISALPAATETADADVIPKVHGGVTQKVTRDILLTGMTGENVTLTGAMGNIVKCWYNGSVGIVGGGGQGISLLNETFTGSITLGGPGYIQLNADAGQALTLNANGSEIGITNTGDINMLLSGGTQVTISYLEGTPSDWSVNPGDVWTALDRIASAVRILRGSPIP